MYNAFNRANFYAPNQFLGAGNFGVYQQCIAGKGCPICLQALLVIPTDGFGIE